MVIFMFSIVFLTEIEVASFDFDFGGEVLKEVKYSILLIQVVESVLTVQFVELG